MSACLSHQSWTALQNSKLVMWSLKGYLLTRAMFKATIQATKAALLNRELKATEMVEAILKEIEHKKYLNIFLSINKENALESAKTIDKDIEHNIERVNKLPLLGIPIA